MRKNLLTLFALLFCSLSAWADASGTCGGGLSWTFTSTNNTLTITYDGEGSGVMDSWSNAGYVPWYSCRSQVYYVSLPDGLKSIGGAAFCKCNNASITLPNSVTTLSNNAFYNSTALRNVTLPSSLTSIGDYTFNGCTGLTDITVNWTSLSGVSVSSSAFNGVTTSNVTLHVPAGKKRMYAAMSPWSGFIIIEASLPGKFSISTSKQIKFSCGNLQYQASSGYWRFAEHQYDYVGNTSVGNVSEGDVKCSNTNISNSYSGWIDLFGWATSGNSASGTAYQPYSSSTNDTEYGPAITSGEWTAANSDWGVVNATQLENGWRTLSSSEWSYLLSSRTNAKNLRTFATVCDVQGLILLPDGWTATNVSLSITTANFTTNTINASDWATLEAQGAVFLPKAGFRLGTSVYDAGTQGCYWTSTASDATHATYLDFYNGFLSPMNYNRFYGYAVRLTHELPAASVTTAPTAITGLVYNGCTQALVNAGTASGGTLYYSLDNSTWSTAIPTGTNAGNYTVYYKVVGDADHSDYTPASNTVAVTVAKDPLTRVVTVGNGKYVVFSPGNLQYQASTDSWRFEERRDDYFMSGNSASIENRSTQSYWIDLFGWGTSGYNDKYPWLASYNPFDYDTEITSGTFPDEYDWGKYNTSKLGPGWRTLTRDEWDYLFNRRYWALIWRVNAQVYGKKGLILMPDGWEQDGVYLQPGSYNNVLSDEQWNTLKGQGCIFLPASGYREYGSVNEDSERGYYWASTAWTMTKAYAVQFENYDNIDIDYRDEKNHGYSVRLVKEVSVAPKGRTIRANGSAQPLVDAGFSSTGTMLYKVGDGDWSASIPTATAAGDYTVYYKIQGDANHGDFTPPYNTVYTTVLPKDGWIDAWQADSIIVRTNALDLTGKTATISTNGTERTSGLALTEIDKGYWRIAANLNTYAGQTLQIQFNTTPVCVIDTIVPYIVSSNALLGDLSVPTNADVQVVAGTLTVEADAAIEALDIYPDAKVVVTTGINLSVNSLTMRADGISDLYPQLVANGNIFNANNDSIYYDYTVDYEQYYPLAVPYDVSCSAIRTRSGKPASYEIQWYNSEDRAANAHAWTVLDDQAPGATLHMGQGYIVFGVPYKWNGTRQKTTTIRFPMKANLTSGEQAKTVPIHLYGNEGTNASNRNWNFIANPYLATYQHDEDDELLQTDAYIQDMSIQGSGESYVSNEDGIRYVTYSNDGYQSYIQEPIGLAELLPFHGYFVQAALEGDLIFDIESRAPQHAPRRAKSSNHTSNELALGIVLSSADAEDRIGLLYGDAFTDEYELNADLVKMFGSAQGLSVYSMAGDEARAFNALADCNRDVPIGFRNAPPGELTFAFDSERYDASPLEAVLLTDSEQNETVNLLNEDYRFITSKADDDNRFVLSVIARSPQVATDIEMTNDQLPISNGVYDVLGRRVTEDKPSAGIYIILENGQSRKEVRQ